MFLSDKDILAEVKAGNITLEPFDAKRLQPATYDIRLGNTFIVNEPHSPMAMNSFFIQVSRYLDIRRSVLGATTSSLR